MAAQIISSIVQAVGRGEFILARKVAQAIKASGTARVAMLCQLPWGPVGVLTPFVSHKAFRDTFSPDGFDRTGAGYLTATKFPWADLQIVRVLGAGAAAASFAFQTSAAVNCLLVPALFKGSGGNAISGTVADASSGVASSFDLTATITDSLAGLNTTETFKNLDSTQTGASYWAAATPGSNLLGGLTKLGVGRPANGTHLLAGGTDGKAAIASIDYLGTPGSADRGVAVLEALEGNDAPAVFFTDDPGPANLAAVNAGLKAHQALMADKRIAILQGLPGEPPTAAKANGALNVGDHCAYVWGHCFGFDDLGTTRTIPLTGPLACILTAMQPHLSPAFKNEQFTQVLGWIQGLDVSTSSKQVKADLETHNVIAFEKNADGTFTPYCDVATNGSPLYVTRSRDFASFTMTAALDQYRNGPNDDEMIQEEREIIETLLARWKSNRKIDHLLRFSIIDYELLPTAATNTQADLDEGDCTQQYKMKVASSQKRFFLVAEVGTTVKVTSATGG
jgi:hypothetical protein